MTSFRSYLGSAHKTKFEILCKCFSEQEQYNKILKFLPKSQLLKKPEEREREGERKEKEKNIIREKRPKELK